MNVRLLARTPDAERVCAAAARNCYSGESPSALLCSLTDEDVGRVLDRAVERGHTSVLEHATFTFSAVGISRVCLAQLTRHRLASYSVTSQRYVACDGRAPVVPELIDDAAGHDIDLFYMIGEAYKDLKKITEILRARGVPEEDIRYLWPEGSVTDVVFTMNAREIHHFLSLRMCGRAQKEIRTLADKVYALCMMECPMLFRLAGTGCMRGKCTEGGCRDPAADRYGGVE